MTDDNKRSDAASPSQGKSTPEDPAVLLEAALNENRRLRAELADCRRRSAPDPAGRERTRDEALIEALQHRLRNTFGTIRSVIRRGAHAAQDVEEYAAHLDGRIGALTRAHATFLRDFDHGTDLENHLAEELLASGGGESDRMSVAGPSVRIGARAAELLGLTMHELTTNAIKFGGLSGVGGFISVTWEIASRTPAQLILRWRETGSREPTELRRGFGAELLERVLPYELGAKVEKTRQADILTYMIEAPLRRVAFTPPAIRPAGG